MVDERRRWLRNGLLLWKKWLLEEFKRANSFAYR